MKLPKKNLIDDANIVIYNSFMYTNVLYCIEYTSLGKVLSVLSTQGYL